eukprot:9483964-Pyramimonas_sp.AAC.1
MRRVRREIIMRDRRDVCQAELKTIRRRRRRRRRQGKIPPHIEVSTSNHEDSSSRLFGLRGPSLSPRWGEMGGSDEDGLSHPAPSLSPS